MFHICSKCAIKWVLWPQWWVNSKTHRSYFQATELAVASFEPQSWQYFLSLHSKSPRLLKDIRSLAIPANGSLYLQWLQVSFIPAKRSPMRGIIVKVENNEFWIFQSQLCFNLQIMNILTTYHYHRATIKHGRRRVSKLHRTNQP